MIDSDGVILPDRPFIRTPYNYDRYAASVASGLVSDEVTRTQQQFKDECDINTIVRNFGLTGQLPFNERTPLTGDYTEVVNDYQSALNMVMAADAAFMELPSNLRERFHNNPQELLEFVQDPRNKDEADKLGILRGLPKEDEPMRVRVVADPKDNATPTLPGVPPVPASEQKKP